MPEFTSNEERFAYAEKLAADKAAKELQIHTAEWKPFGGDCKTKRSCTTCRFVGETKHTFAPKELRCNNPAVNLQGRSIKDIDLRGTRGLCGPDGAFYKKQPMVSNDIIGIIGGLFIVLLMIGLAAGALIHFLGWGVMWIVLAITGFVLMAVD